MTDAIEGLLGGRRAQDERDRRVGERVRGVLARRSLTYQHVAELALERRRAADTLAAEVLEGVATALGDEEHHRAACRLLAESAAMDWPDGDEATHG